MTQFLYLNGKNSEASIEGYRLIGARDGTAVEYLNRLSSNGGGHWYELKACSDGAFFEAIFDSCFQFTDGIDPSGNSIVGLISILSQRFDNFAFVYGSADGELEVVRSVASLVPSVESRLAAQPVELHVGMFRS